MKTFRSWLESISNEHLPILLGCSRYLYQAHFRIQLSDKIYTYHCREWIGIDNLIKDLDTWRVALRAKREGDDKKYYKFRNKVWKAYNDVKKEAGDSYEVEEA